MPKFIFALVVSLLLAACKSAPKKMEYNPQSLPQDKLASIVTSGGYEKDGYIFGTSIAGVYNEKGTRIVKTYEPLSGYAAEVKLPEGKYLVQVMCSLGVTTTFYNYQTLEVSVRPNEKYIVYCLDKMGKGLFGLAVPDGSLAFISKDSDFERERAINQTRINALPLKKD